MDYIGNIFNLVFFGPVINLLVLILRALQGVQIPGALGFSIIILTLAIRVLIWPFIATQMRSSKKMADLKPHLNQLAKKHQGDKQALAAAQLALYKEHGINPAAGCLPALIQLPMVIALYQTILALFDGQSGLSKLNTFLYSPSWQLTATPDLNFLGINLAAKPSEFAALGYLLLLIPILTAVLQFAQSKMMAPKPVKPYPGDSPKEKHEKKESEDTMSAMQSQMTYMMPLMIGVFSWQFPVGISLYWNTFTLLGILQQYRISGWGGLEPVINKISSRFKA